MQIILRRQDFGDAPFFHALEADEAPFFQELDRAIFEAYDSPFFNELEAGIQRDKEYARRLAKRQAHCSKWHVQARRLVARIAKVNSIDLHKMAQHLPIDFFGVPTARFDYVRTLYVRKARILWHLTGLYYYYAFYEKSHNGWHRRNGLTYEKQRPIFDRLLAEHKVKTIDRRKQEKWDKKRERVRKGREKKQKEADVPRHIHRTHFNGYSYVDPYVKKGQLAILDDGYSRSEIVIVKDVGKVFATVARTPTSPEWGVMLVRLTRFEDGKK